MKSKEVLSAMTPLPWRIKKFSAFNTNILGNGEWGRENDICEMSGTHSKSAQNTNAAAIVSAVNATYGSGIDPLAVKDLLDVLVALMPNDSVYDLPKGSNLQLTIPVEIFANAKAAISKATIKK